MAEDILTTRPGSYQQDVLQSFLSLSIMVKWMTDANNASNVISEVKRTPLAAMTDLLISTKSALRRPITYITAVKRQNVQKRFKSCPWALYPARKKKIYIPDKRSYIPTHICKIFHFALSLLN